MPYQPLLFTPLSIGQLSLANRIVIPPMCMYAASTDGIVGPFHRMHVGSMATSGAGLVILEATAVRPEGRITHRCCGLWDDATEAAWQQLIEDVRCYSDTPLAIQLAHAGRKASHQPPTLAVAAANRQMTPGDTDGGWQTVAPSAIAYEEGECPPVALTVDEVHELVDAFVAAAVRADRIGIEAIEIHCAHGYLIHEFLSPLTNHRSDEYGGSPENRMRLALEIFEKVRAAVPKSKPVWVRVSATEYMDAAGGWNVDDAVQLAKELKKLGCDLIHVSSGGNHPDQQMNSLHRGYQLEFAKRIKEEADIPVIGVGLIINSGEAEVALASGAADAIAIGRQILFNPHWPYQAAHELRGKIVAPPSYWRSEPSPSVDIFLK